MKDHSILTILIAGAVFAVLAIGLNLAMLWVAVLIVKWVWGF